MNVDILKPRIGLPEATKKLGGRLRELKLGRLHSIIDFYIPYLVFEVTLTNAGKTVRATMAVDSVTGQLDPYAFDALETSESSLADPRRAARARLSAARAREILEERIKRDLYLKGFFRVKDPRVEAACAGTAYIPYWVGIYMRGERVRLAALSALSGLVEGPKVEEIISEHFRESAIAESVRDPSASLMSESDHRIDSRRPPGRDVAGCESNEREQR